MKIFAVALCVLLTACSVSTTSAETDDKRFEACVEAGGTFWKDGIDWGCDMPNASSHNPKNS